jgi:hypothetical protein
MRLTLLAAALTLCACDQLSVEAQVPAICQTLTNQKFSIPPELRAAYALLPPSMRSGYELGKTFDFDLPVEAPAGLQGLESRFTLTSVRLTAAAPTVDLGFMQSVRVTLEPPANSALPAHTIEYVRTTPNPTEALLDGAGFDLAPYLASGSLRYTLAMVGTLPDTDLAVDVEICAAALVRFSYLPQ